MQREELDLVGAVGARQENDELEKTPKGEVSDRHSWFSVRSPRIAAKVAEQESGKKSLLNSTIEYLDLRGG